MSLSADRELAAGSGAGAAPACLLPGQPLLPTLSYRVAQGPECSLAIYSPPCSTAATLTPHCLLPNRRAAPGASRLFKLACRAASVQLQVGGRACTGKLQGIKQIKAPPQLLQLLLRQRRALASLPLLRPQAAALGLVLTPVRVAASTCALHTDHQAPYIQMCQ